MGHGGAVGRGCTSQSTRHQTNKPTRRYRYIIRGLGGGGVLGSCMAVVVYQAVYMIIGGDDEITEPETIWKPTTK